MINFVRGKTNRINEKVKVKQGELDEIRNEKRNEKIKDNVMEKKIVD